jgi:coatomer subunit beta
MKDMESPNEYLAGCTLRFVSKISDTDILSLLIPSVIRTLQHTHPYVRRHGILCVHSIYAHHMDLFPDAPHKLLDILIYVLLL